MSIAAVALAKSWLSEVPASYWKMRIRVVVLNPKASASPEENLEQLTSAELDDVGSLTETGRSPLDSYLERPTRGRQCVMFLVHGQRHEGWDNSFIVSDLGFKYLKNRTMVIVELDGLAPEAIAEVVQGSRQGLYKGNVLHAIRERIVATLKSDPDLKRLQAEAEQKIAELEAGDEAVKTKLDQLIEEHHATASHPTGGGQEPGALSGVEPLAPGEPRPQDVVVGALPDVGEPGIEPVLLTEPPTTLIRLRPQSERTLVLRTRPESEWPNVKAITQQMKPVIDGLAVEITSGENSGNLKLLFVEPDDLDVEDYPIETMLSVFARLRGYPEPRMIDKKILINKASPPPPPPPPILREDPTFLRVVSRQPVKLLPGGPSTHVKLRWDGEDWLASGSHPIWLFRARCLSLSTFPVIAFSKPVGGRFELLLDSLHGLPSGEQLDFKVEAVGPRDRKLSALFSGDVLETVSELPPRTVTATPPEPASHRRPPYELKYVEERDWDKGTCWGESDWTKEDSGCFTEPTEGSPLVLLVNKDSELLKTYREEMIKRQLDENTVKARLTRYTAHTAFHLYQMYRSLKAKREFQTLDERVHVPDDTEMQDEINRVATTLIKLMQVAH
jgi:hypothetical protein